MVYCTNRDLKDVFPAIDEFDTKTALYGFVVDSSSRYKANNVGLVTQLFANGKNLGSAESSSSNVNDRIDYLFILQHMSNMTTQTPGFYL